ncbi:MAG: hypothetical protein ACRD5K_08715 [Candidatus Acidiferrales bacterium]
MNAIAALLAVLARTVAQQEAVVNALRAKNLLSDDEIRSALPSPERIKEIVDSLNEEYVDDLRKIEANAVSHNQQLPSEHA